ncbi:MAG: hypothetical protein M3322_00980 [Actinomycetota bacterium]|nr:hypothetical protein [Actinomycetota bacterium]
MGAAHRPHSASVGVLWLVLLVGAGGEEARAQAACPNPEKTLDYNCPVGPSYVIPGLTDLNGWKEPAHYRNILVGDLTGDAADELVARGAAGIQVYRFDATAGQWSRVHVNPILPDAAGWAQRKYYETLRLGDVDGNGNAELVARGPAGIVVFGYKPGSTPDTGTWEQLTTSGPMADKDCFSNGKCWGDDESYYSTIQLGHFNSGNTPTLLGRGADGLVTYFWNGSGWTQGPGISDLSDANGWNRPEYYSTIRLAVQGAVVLARGKPGMLIYEFTPGQPSTWRQLAKSGPFADTDCFSNGKCWNSGPEYYSTIQVAPAFVGDQEVVIGRGADGVHVYEFGPEGDGSTWGWEEKTDPAGQNPLPDAAGFDKPQYYRTIQTAQINGQGSYELLARTPTGMVAYGFDPFGRWSAPIAAGEPALADKPWALDPSYYETIKPATLLFAPPVPTHGLLARGPHGIRTWRFDAASSTWSRYLPYGNFPNVDDNAFTKLNTFLGIANGTIRSIYTDPTSNPASSQLQGYQNSIAQTCTGLISANPPRYQSCTPPASVPGVSPPAWTAVSNQILAELFWAQQVLDHFTTLEGINTQLFLDEDSEFPAIGDELKLSQAPNVVAEVDYLSLFEGVLDLLALIPAGGEVFEFTAAALGIAAAATATGSGSEPTEFDHKFAEMETHIATIRQETQDAITAQRHYVLGDYGLLQTVGHLVASQIWRLDTQAALSAGRQGFTHWAYRGLLPVLWDRWAVNGCKPWQQDVCQPPQNGKGMKSYVSHPDGSTDFDGLVPRQTPCAQGFTFHCNFASLESQGYTDALNTLREPVATDCLYDPQAGKSWEYGTCALGVSWDELEARDSNGFAIWPFRFFSCTQTGIDNSECVRNQPSSLVAGKARGLGTRATSVELAIEEPLRGKIDLRRATVTLVRYLHEGAVTGAGELVNRPGGRDATPHTLRRTRSSRGRAVFRAPRGRLPRVVATLAVRGGRLHATVRVSGARLDAPKACDRRLKTTHLRTHLVVRAGRDRTVQSLSMAPWRCVRDRTGIVRRLQLRASRPSPRQLPR